MTAEAVCRPGMFFDPPDAAGYLVAAQTEYTVILSDDLSECSPIAGTALRERRGIARLPLWKPIRFECSEPASSVNASARRP